MGQTQARLSSTDVVVVLRSARGSSPDPRLDDVLKAFRRQWSAIARKRFPRLGDDLDDALQEAMMKLTDPHRLDTLRDPTRIEAWGRSLFVYTVFDFMRVERSHAAARDRPAGGHDEDGDEEAIEELLSSGTWGPEEIATHQQRVQLIVGCIDGIEVARLKFVEDLPDNEIAARCNLTRD